MGPPLESMMKRTFLIIILLVFVVGSVSIAQSDGEAGLRNRVLRYHSHFELEQYGEMWDMSSKKLRDGNDNDKEEFVRYLRKHHLPKVKTKLISLQLDGTVAKAKVEISLWVAEESRWLSETDEQTWVLENNDWYFDTFRLAEESKSK